jgi:hypothetical protein
MVAADVFEHPLISVITTVYEPEVLTMIDWVTAPVFHKYELAVLAISVIEPPWQNVVGPPGVMDTAGKGLTVIDCDAVFAHPLPSVMVTV